MYLDTRQRPHHLSIKIDGDYSRNLVNLRIYKKLIALKL
ncbi:hypothetical protein CSUNSWCD_548 [Campylobacter showae CSUNSWCD]|uniref:Uncharacterized protein n=1 Tax=Campylobacter showae CSUNSWCD TaxID=1244083 RepID=M5IEC5_9BACT|nr:hypothetical protein CSUNSWCD_548 [Campylobacter showae CSUNSWCD]